MLSTLTPLASLIGMLSPVERKTKPSCVFIKRVNKIQTMIKQEMLIKKTASSLERPNFITLLKMVLESPIERLGTPPMILILIE